MPTPALSSDAYKLEIKQVAGLQLQVIELLADAQSMQFIVPAGARLVRIQGILLAPESVVISPAVQYNGDSSAVYNYMKNNQTTAGTTIESRTAVTGFQFTSSFGDSELSVVDVTVKVETIAGLSGSRQIFKGTGFNNGGVDGDYHECVGWANNAADIATIEFVTLSPFANSYGAGTFLTMEQIL